MKERKNLQKYFKLPSCWALKLNEARKELLKPKFTYRLIGRRCAGALMVRQVDLFTPDVICMVRLAVSSSKL